MPRKPSEEVNRPKCPVCGLPALEAHDPFCSRRCADVDLGRWFSGAYAIPSSPGWEDDEEFQPDTDTDQEDGQGSQD